MHDTPQTSRQVIVSGATGFVGQHLVPLLAADGYDVIAMGRDIEKAKQYDWFDQVTFLTHDFHKSTVSLDIGHGANLIHLAWQGLPNYQEHFHFEENLPCSYAFVKRLVEAGVAKVLVAGTCFEYGLRNGPIPGDTPTRPANPYALAKDCLRQYLEYLQREFPFTLQWARLFYMYGKGQNPNSIIAQLDRAIENGDAVFNMSGGEQLRDYLPVESVAVQLYERFQSNLNGTFNVCSGRPISIRRLVEERIRQKGASIKMNLGYYPYPEHEPMAFWGTTDTP